LTGSSTIWLAGRIRVRIGPRASLPPTSSRACCTPTNPPFVQINIASISLENPKRQQWDLTDQYWPRVSDALRDMSYALCRRKNGNSC
jgi:hypothetical protein